MKILVIDDEHLLLTIINTYFSLHDDIHCTTSKSVIDAREKLSTSKFDLIFCDKNIAGYCGIEFFLDIKKNSNFNTPFILMTGDDDFIDSEEAMHFGFYKLLSKPINFEILDECIASVITQ